MLPESSVLISIIIPVYNAEFTLEKCVNSVLYQDNVKDCEIILVNDGSTDFSQLIIDSLVSQHPGIIKSIVKENKGPGDTRNVGIRNASGQYIAFLDSDDSLAPDYLSVLLSTIHRYEPDLILIDYNRIYTREQNVFERAYRFKRLKHREGVFNIKDHPELISEAEVASWLRVVRKDLFERNLKLFFSEELKIAEDLEASLKWYLFTNKILVLDKKIYNYMIRSASLNFSAGSVAQFVKVLDNVCAFYISMGRFTEFEKQLEYVCSKHVLLSNLLRLWSSKKQGSYGVFRQLRSQMMLHFPAFSSNTYLKSEPFYVRLALRFAEKTPWIFRLVLR